MPARTPTRLDQARRRVALEAARLISESGLRDYRQARLKAAQRLGVHDEAGLPRDSEIEDALREHQRLFHAGTGPGTLRRLREVAREAMDFFSAFEPRLVGAVLDGTADEHSAVSLHLHTDQVEEVLSRLQEHAIPYEERDRPLRFGPGRAEAFPALRFSADGTTVDLTILPYDRLRQAPLDRAGERPMPRATLAALRALLVAEGSATE
jgi:hypothetical protein